MSLTEQQVQRVHVTLEEARDARDLGRAIQRLNENEDFIRVFTKEFFLNDAARVVGMMTREDAIKNPHQMRQLENRIIAIGETQQFLRYSLKLGQLAEQSIEEHEPLLNEE